MEDKITIKRPDGALTFLTPKEFYDYRLEFERGNRPFEIEGEPDEYPCVGFPVHSYYVEGRKDKTVFAFVYYG